MAIFYTLQRSPAVLLSLLLIGRCLAVDQDELNLDPHQFTTYVRLQSSEHSYSVTGVSAYEGLGLMVETKHNDSGNPVFFATIMFETANGVSNDPNLLFSYPSKVNVKYCVGQGYNDLLRGIKKPYLRVNKVKPEDDIEANGTSNLYRENLKGSFVQLETPTPLSLPRLINFLEGMTIQEGNERRFPYYTKPGYSFYHDSINCIGFCLRAINLLLKQDEEDSPLTGPLKVYLNHDYSGKNQGFFSRIEGWFRTRVPRTSVRNLTIEYCLKNLFTDITYEYLEELRGTNDGRTYRKITDQNNQILRFEEVREEGVVQIDNMDNIQTRVIRSRSKTEKIATLRPAFAEMKLLTITDGQDRLEGWNEGANTFSVLRINEDIKVLFKKFGETPQNIEGMEVLAADRFF